MTGSDPLAGLDEIDWARLRHAYGWAADVPDQLRALRSADPAKRERARWELYTNIFHQGGRYEAAAYAVPFLLAMAADAATPDRTEVIRMLVALAIGYDDDILPEAFDVAAACSDAAEQRAYEAVRAGVPRLCALLEDPIPNVRAAAAYALAWFPEESTRIVPRLIARLDKESDSGVIANVIVALGLLGDTRFTGRFRLFLHGEDPLVRWASATALARIGVVDAEVIGELADSIVEQPEQGEPGVEFYEAYEGRLREYSAAVLMALEPAAAIDAVIAKLAQPRDFTETFILARVALRLAFGDEAASAPPRRAHLSERQRRVVTAIARLPEGPNWTDPYFRELVRCHGVPGERAECRRYVGLSAD